MNFFIGLILVTLDVMILFRTFLAWASLCCDARTVLIFSLFSEFLGIFLRDRNKARLLSGEMEFLLGSITAIGSTLLSLLLLRRVVFNPNKMSLSNMLHDGDVIRSGSCFIEEKLSSGSLN